MPEKTFLSTPPKKYVMIKEFTDEIKSLKNILNEIKNLELLREQEINEIKYKTNRMLNMLDDQVNNILGKLYVDLVILRVKCEFFKNLMNTISLKRKEN